MYFEDIKIGDKVELADVSVDKEEMVAFAKRYNPVPFHADEEFAKTPKKSIKRYLYN